jgi:DNA-binding CsgD family transcriptional regulator
MDKKLPQPQHQDIRRQSLNPREYEVLRYLVTSDLPHKEIAKTLFVEEKTIKFHCTNIYKKLRSINRIGTTNAYIFRRMPQDVLEYLDAFYHRQSEKLPHKPAETAPFFIDPIVPFKSE